jgi:NAD+ synthase
VAALCVEALGKDRVIGVLMPNGEQADIDMAKLLVNTLGIKHYVINIKDAVDGLVSAIPFELSEQSKTNLPPRIRMSTLYAVSQSNNSNYCRYTYDNSKHRHKSTIAITNYLLDRTFKIFTKLSHYLLSKYHC